ncbi:hypothetical protein ANCCAN_10323, partial [Ancylostoma caninum]
AVTVEVPSAKNATSTSSGKTEEAKVTKETNTLKTGKKEKGLSRWIKAVDRDVRLRKDEVVGDTKDKGLADTLKGISGGLNGEGTRADLESTGDSSNEGTRGEHDPKKLVNFSGGGSNSATIPARHNKLKKIKVEKNGKKGKDDEAQEDENGPLGTVDGEVKVPNPVDGDTGEDDDNDEEKNDDEEIGTVDVRRMVILPTVLLLDETIHPKEAINLKETTRIKETAHLLLTILLDRVPSRQGLQQQRGGQRGQRPRDGILIRSLDYLTSKEKVDNAKRSRGQILDELHGGWFSEDAPLASFHPSSDISKMLFLFCIPALLMC